MDPLTHPESTIRFSSISDVDYSLMIEVGRTAEKFEGDVVVSFMYREGGTKTHSKPGLFSGLLGRKTKDIDTWMDFAGGVVLSHSFEEVPEGANPPELWTGSGRVKLGGLKEGRYRVRLKYSNEFAEDRCGLIRWSDPQDGETYVYTHFEPYGANQMCPCFDQPDLKASFSLTVTAPSTWTVVSNSPCQSSCASSPTLSTHKFLPTLRISTYLWALCAGPFSEWSHPWPYSAHPLRLFCRKAISALFPADKIFAWTVASFQYLTAYLAQDYDFGKYDQVFVPELDAGAMENVGCVVFSDSYIYKDGTLMDDIAFCNTVIHENVHVWLGNTVTMKWWGDVWLNESFATYLSAKAQFEMFPQMKSTLMHTFLTYKEAAYDCDELPNPRPVRKSIEIADCKHQAFDLITYVKGSSVLEQLEFTIGEPAFQSLLQLWLKRHKYSNATFEDFEELLRETHPEIERDWLEKWVGEAGVNELEAVWEQKDGVITAFEIVQRPSRFSPTLRPHCLTVSLYTSSGHSYFSAKLSLPSVPRQSFVEFLGQPSPHLILLNSTEQGHCKTCVRCLSLPIVSKLDSSVARHCVLRSLLHSVRDGSVPAPVYIETSASVLATEREIGLCYFVANTAFVALLACVSPGNDRKRLASLVFCSILERIKAESDPSVKAELQSYLFRFLIHPCDVMQAVQWLHSPPGCMSLRDIDRIEVIKHYAEISPAAVRLAEIEKERNPGQNTEFLARYCWAAAPVPPIKDQVFSVIHHDVGSMRKEEARAIMKGFSQGNQYWLQPYALTMMRNLHELMRPPLKDIAEDYVMYMAPLYIEPSEVLKRIGPLLWIVKAVSKKASQRCEEVMHRLALCDKCRKLSREYFWTSSA